jgi:hypothetical protein
MTLEELESTLPNGLHDAEVKRIAIDYEVRRATLEIAFWVGDMDDPPERREAYKNGRVSISGLLFFVMEPPDPKYPFMDADLRIDGCDMSKNLSSELLRSLPSNSFIRSLWVNEWNAFIHIAATDARVEWLNDGAVTYRTATC